MIEKISLSKKIQPILVWIPLLTIIFFVLVILRFIYYWDVFLPVYRNLLYSIALLILLGLLIISFIPRNHTYLKVAVLVMTAPIFLFSTLMLFEASPVILDTKHHNNHTYYLFAENEPLKPRMFIRVLVCRTKSFECNQTSFEERADIANRHYYLMVNSERNEVYVLDQSQVTGYTHLLYAFGEYPRYYAHPEQLGDQLFYLAYYRNSEPRSYTYMLFQCDLDHKDCIRLPFEYQGFVPPARVEVVVFASTIKIFLLNDANPNELGYEKETLVYSWGEHPRCYVEGCEIPEP